MYTAKYHIIRNSRQLRMMVINLNLIAIIRDGAVILRDRVAPFDSRCPLETAILWNTLFSGKIIVLNLNNSLYIYIQ